MESKKRSNQKIISITNTIAIALESGLSNIMLTFFPRVLVICWEKTKLSDPIMYVKILHNMLFLLGGGKGWEFFLQIISLLRTFWSPFFDNVKIVKYTMFLLLRIMMSF